MATEVAVAYVTLAPSARGFGAKMRQAIGPEVDATGRDSGGRFSGMFGAALRTGAKVAGGALVGVLGYSLAKGFSRLNDIDQAKNKLLGLKLPASTVQVAMDNALKAVKGTAFGLGDAASQAATLVASGVKPGKELERTLSLMADSAFTAGTNLDDMGSIFSDVAAGGKVTGDTIARLTERGIPIIQLLAKTTGKSIDQVRSDISKGAVSFGDFQEAIEEGFGGAAKKSGETFSGAFDNMKAALGRFGAGLLEGVFAKGPALFGKVTEALDLLTPAAKRLGDGVGKAISKLSGLFKGNVDTSVLTKAFRDASEVFNREVRPALDELKVAFEKAWDVIFPIVKDLSKAIKSAFGEGDGASGAVKTAVSVIADAISFAAAYITAYVQVIQFVWKNFGTRILALTRVAVKTVIGVFSGAMTIIKGIFKTATAFLRGDWKGVWDGIKTILRGAWRIITSILSGSLGQVRALFGNSLVSMRERVRGGMSSIAESFRSGISSAVRTVAGLPGRAVAALAGLSTRLYNAGSKAIGSLIQGIKDRIGDLGEAVGAVADKIGGFFFSSPVKEGKLTSWNDGKAGERLVDMGLIRGLKNRKGKFSSALSDFTTVPAFATADVGFGSIGSARMPSAQSLLPGGATTRLHPDDLAALGDWMASRFEVALDANTRTQNRLGNTVAAGGGK